MDSPPSALKRAVLAYEAARSNARRPKRLPPDCFGPSWSLVAQVEVRGTRYALARRVLPRAHGVERLTPREIQVLELIASGHTSKVTAYELGIADATVRVLLVRAARKLGARSRSEAIARFVATREGGETDQT
jgi:DNA-binding CsgD family transcriptional regulator